MTTVLSKTAAFEVEAASVLREFFEVGFAPRVFVMPTYPSKAVAKDACVQAMPEERQDACVQAMKVVEHKSLTRLRIHRLITERRHRNLPSLTNPA